MAALGIPSEVLVGLCVGGSASFMILVELPSDSPLARELMKTRGRRIALSSALTLALGYFTNPLTGIVAELLVYPAFAIKGRMVRRQLKRIASDLEPGESVEIEYKGVTHAVTKPMPATKEDRMNFLASTCMA